MHSRSLDGARGGAAPIVLRLARYVALGALAVVALRVFVPGSAVTLGVLAALLLIFAYLVRRPRRRAF